MRQRRHNNYSSVPTETYIRYLEMKRWLPVDTLIKKAEDSNKFLNHHVAREAFDAMVQWLAFHATKSAGSPPSVMMAGGADVMWLMLTSDPDYYVKFCSKHVGYIIGRVSIEGSQTPRIRDCGGIDHTVQGLSAAFGSELCSTLVNWQAMRRLSDKVKSISFVGEMDEDADINSLLNTLWA